MKVHLLPNHVGADDEIVQHIDQLKQITGELVEPVLQYTIVCDACLRLKEMFLKISGLVEAETVNKQDIFTGNGKAIGPAWAASCITDMQRTRAFLQGIKEAIEDKLKNNVGRPVTVLYAGTGPFATLLTPLTTVFTPAQLQLVLLEINPQSIVFLKKIIQQFAMEEYVTAVFETDAALFQIPVEINPDIIVAETMLQALRNEPQVAVSVNLINQCSTETVLIPEMIAVKAGLINLSIEQRTEINELKTLLEFDAGTAVTFKKHQEELPVLTDGLLVEISQSLSADYTHLALLTQIQVYKQNRIQYRQSGLTLDHILLEIKGIDFWPAVFRLRYSTGTEPGFVMTREEGINKADVETHE